MSAISQSSPGPKTISLKSAADWIIPIATVCLVFVMLVPMPTLLLDLLLAISLSASVLVLLVAMYILRPVQFSVFPSLLLLLTLFRLSLNIASSRRILLHGNEGSAAAGHVIEAFGQFVVGGNYVVGFVLFLALIAIQYIVVNHGAVRIAEVTARFTLDALPGKQMAIDADLNAGLIDETTARERRESIGREAEFYGAMDGAARFSQRDAVATILITAINIVAGFLIGVFQLNIPFAEALSTYTTLTVGDGIVTMIPSLLVSVAGAMVATRATSELGLGADLGSQLLSRSKPLWIVSGVLTTLALVPGLPKFSFLSLAVAMGYMARRVQRAAVTEQTTKAPAEKSKAATSEAIEPALKLDEISLEVGYGLVALVDESQGGQMMRRIRALRKHLAQQLGFIIPPVHITDNLRLKPKEYVIQLRGVEIARSEVLGDCYLALSSEPNPAPIEGTPTKEPAFGVDAKWIAAERCEEALAAGYAVVEQTSVIATHVAEIVRRHADELLTRHETKRLLDSTAESCPKLAEELVPKIMTLGEVHKVLQQLLREQVSIRDLATILEALIEAAPVNKSLVTLVETSRQALGRALVHPLLGEDGKLTLLTIDFAIEDEIHRALSGGASVGRSAGVQSSFIRRVLDSLRSLLGEQFASASPVLLCGSPARFYLRRQLEPFLPKLTVLSPAEIPPAIIVQSVGMVS